MNVSVEEAEWQPEWTTYNGRRLLLPRYGTRRDFSRPTLGPAVMEVSRALGTPLMAWQEYVADVALELDPITGLPIYREIWLTVPRQSGKTTLILSLCTHRCIGLGFHGGRQIVKYAAQTRNDARAKWEDEHLVVLEASVFGPLFRPRKTNGNEALIWRNGSMWGITSTTEKAGHGPTIDLGVIDEAFAQEDDRLEQAFKPAMVTRRSAQMIGLSTAGTLQKSKYLKGKVDVGRKLVERGQDKAFAYFEWSAPDSWSIEDPATWRAIMPAMHQPWCPPDCTDHTIYEQTIESDITSMKESDEGIDGARRAYGNQWVQKNRAKPIIPLVVWRHLRDQESQAHGRVGMALECDPDRKHAAIGIYGVRRDGLSHVEVAEYLPGTGWVIDRVIEMVTRWKPYGGIVIDPASAAGAFIRPLRERDIEVTELSAREVVQATGFIYDRAINEQLRHRDQKSLTDALTVARKRNLADAWAWDRRKSDDDISPLVAVTLAAYGYAIANGGFYNVLDSVQ